MLSISALLASSLLARPAAAAIATVISTTTPATTYSTLAFAPIPTNPTGMASNYFQATSSATINGVVMPLDGYSVLARSGYTDLNGNVLGALLVRARARVARRRCASACCAARSGALCCAPCCAL